MSVTYLDYIDLGTGRALFVEPDGSYDIQATGFNAPDIPRDFVPAESFIEPEDSESELTDSENPEVESGNLLSDPDPDPLPVDGDSFPSEI
jgi:hypothetical protein